ncbi:uncharacterized protein LOC142067668 [Phalacrocorax aristotelis]|uniref:uncharacterized protein LOC142067668 n=1 Tax=Phalacrocorax aristotelis TaxID=126867 RepID=UPI003F4C633A
MSRLADSYCSAAHPPHTSHAAADTTTGGQYSRPSHNAETGTLGYSVCHPGVQQRGGGMGDPVLWKHAGANARVRPAGTLSSLLSPALASGTVPAAGGNKQSDASDGTFPLREGAAGRLHPTSGHPPPMLSIPWPCGSSLCPQPSYAGHLPPAVERSGSGSLRDALDGCPLPAWLPSPCPAAAGLASSAGSATASLQRDFPGNVPSSRVWHQRPTQQTPSLSRWPVSGKERSRPPAAPSHPLPFSAWQHHSWGSFLSRPPTRGRMVPSCLQPSRSPRGPARSPAQKSHRWQDPAMDRRTPGSPRSLPSATLTREVMRPELTTMALTPTSVRGTETGMDPRVRSGGSSHRQQGVTPILQCMVWGGPQGEPPAPSPTPGAAFPRRSPQGAGCHHAPSQPMLPPSSQTSLSPPAPPQHRDPVCSPSVTPGSSVPTCRDRTAHTASVGRPQAQSCHRLSLHTPFHNHPPKNHHPGSRRQGSRTPPRCPPCPVKQSRSITSQPLPDPNPSSRRS